MISNRQIAEFGRLLRVRREAAGFSRKALAIQAGVSEPTIKDCEGGKRLLGRKSLLRLIQVKELRLTEKEAAAVLGKGTTELMPADAALVNPQLAMQLGRAEEALRGAEALAKDQGSPVHGILQGLRAVLNGLLPQRTQ